MTPDMLVQLAADLKAGRHPDDRAAGELIAAIGLWFEGLSLDEALDLRSDRAGREHARTQYRRSLRDRHLRRAAELMGGPPGHRRTVALHHEIERFIGSIWPSWKHLDAPPERASALRRELFAAAKAYRLPQSLSGLRNSINSAY